MKESKLEKQVCEEAKKRGWTAIKLASRVHDPDRVFLREGGIAVFIEFKQLNQKPRKGQVARIEHLRTLGFSVTVADNVGDALDFLKEHES